MLTKIAAKSVVDPATALRDTEPTASEEVVVSVEGNTENIEKIWEFVKNIQTHEVIIFEDGGQYRFASSLLVTADKALAEKLLAVAGKYHIIHRNP